jgi:hypothetical protein
METYVITLPEVKSVAVAPNPVAALASVTITAVVEEVTKILEPSLFYAGELQAGEWP